MIYFIQAESADARIKIGFTSRRLSARLPYIQCGCPYEIKVLKCIAGEPHYERQLHHKFDRARVSGEWFRPIRSLRAFIDNAPGIDPELVPLQRDPDARRGTLKQLHNERKLKHLNIDDIAAWDYYKKFVSTDDLAVVLKVSPASIERWSYVPSQFILAVANYLGVHFMLVHPSIYMLAELRRTADNPSFRQLRPDIYTPPASPWAELSSSKGTTKL